MLATLLVGAALVVLSSTAAAYPYFGAAGSGGLGTGKAGKPGGTVGAAGTGTVGIADIVGGKPDFAIRIPAGMRPSAGEVWQWGGVCPLTDTVPRGADTILQKKLD